MYAYIYIYHNLMLYPINVDIMILQLNLIKLVSMRTVAVCYWSRLV